MYSRNTRKLVVNDDDHHRDGPLNKRLKLLCPLPDQQCNLVSGSFQTPPSQCSPLVESNLLGLKLRKSPSFLDLIHMKLSEGNASLLAARVQKDFKDNTAPCSTDKRKASNFPASFLRIGTWEYKSRFRGDLTAKFYFAQKRLVWEILNGGLKSKIEIKWSDIISLKANYPDDGTGTLDVMLARPPLFFTETDPEPRKHTKWQSTSDFTGGQASIHRRHLLQCTQGLLENVILSDPHLSFLSQQGERVLQSPYFEPRNAVFDDSLQSNHGVDLNGEKGHAVFTLRDTASPSGPPYSPVNNDQLVGGPAEKFLFETLSPCSVMDTHVTEEVKRRRAELSEGIIDAQVPGLHCSVSMTDLFNLIEGQDQERASNNCIPIAEGQPSLDTWDLDEISRILFSDSQHTSTSDEQLVKPESVSAPESEIKVVDDLATPDPEVVSDRVVGYGQALEMCRNDSVGELLYSLPKVAASVPHELFSFWQDFDTI